MDALLLEFDYEGAVVPFDDDRQFVRANAPGGPVFVRRDRTAEAAAQDTIRQDGLVQMRMATGKSEKGRLVFVFRGREAAESWQGFVAERLPALQALGWRNQIDADFGPRLVKNIGLLRPKVADAPQGRVFPGFRHRDRWGPPPLLPILMRLRERGGIAAARIIDGEIVTSLDDGRILKLPSDRIARLLAVMDDLIESAGRTSDETMTLDAAAAPSMLDLEELVTTRWHDGAVIATHVARFRPVADIPLAPVPARFYCQPAALPAAGRQLAAASAPGKSGRTACRRHGPWEDGADHRAHRDRGASGPAGSPRADCGANQPGAELDRRTRPVRAASASCGAAWA